MNHRACTPPCATTPPPVAAQAGALRRCDHTHRLQVCGLRERPRPAARRSPASDRCDRARRGRRPSHEGRLHEGSATTITGRALRDAQPHLVASRRKRRLNPACAPRAPRHRRTKPPSRSSPATTPPCHPERGIRSDRPPRSLSCRPDGRGRSPRILRWSRAQSRDSCRAPSGATLGSAPPPTSSAPTSGCRAGPAMRTACTATWSGLEVASHGARIQHQLDGC